MIKICLAAALFAPALGSPAVAQNAPAPFTGPRAEVLVGTDGSLLFGGGLGYDFQSGRILFGIDGEALFSTEADCEILNSNVQDRLCSKAERDLYAGGRVGFALAPRTLLYGKAGYTNLRLEDSYDPGTSGGVAFKFTDALNGIRVGGGIEQRIGRSAFVKGEYRYSNYEAGIWKHEGMAGLGLRF